MGKRTDDAGVEQCLDADPNCRGCGSDKHTKYEVKGESLDIDGQRITWKATVCTGCGQHRRNRFSRPTPQSGGRGPK